MRLGVTLDILNQKDTPAFYADTLANRPAAGFTGRIFVSTDTLDLYRDTGTTWVLLSPSSTGTITGSGAAGQVTYFSAASSITGSNNLFFDSVNGHLGIGTITPSTALTIFHDQNQIIQINQTTATNDTKIAFQNSGTPLWRIGNSYNAGANDYAIYDVVGAIQPLTIKKTTGQTFIGAETTSSGKLVVNQTAADNGLVVLGASTPSIRVRNAGTAPTQQFGLGLATGVNNFIQGSASGDFCIFNGSTTASPILFGVYDAVAVSVQEAARISAARNFLVNTSVDNGQKFQVNGTSLISGAASFTNTVTISPSFGGTATNDFLIVQRTGGAVGVAIGYDNPATAMYFGTNTNHNLQFRTNNNTALTITTSANVLINTTDFGAEGLGIQNQKNVSFVEGSGESYVNIFRQRNSAAGVLAQGLKRSLTGEWASSLSSSSARSAVVVGYNAGSIAFYSDSSTTVPNGTDIVTTPKMLLQNTGNLILGNSVDAGQKLQVNGDIAINKGNSNTAIFDTNGTTLSLAIGGTADFPNFSGMLLVTNYNTGAFQIFVCGGGSTASVFLLGGAIGTFTYNIGINGYTFTSTSATATYNFTAFKTRPNA
jgi:hypothetical protein